MNIAYIISGSPHLIRVRRLSDLLRIRKNEAVEAKAAFDAAFNKGDFPVACELLKFLKFRLKQVRKAQYNLRAALDQAGTDVHEFPPNNANVLQVEY